MVAFVHSTDALWRCLVSAGKRQPKVASSLHATRALNGGSVRNRRISLQGMDTSLRSANRALITVLEELGDLVTEELRRSYLVDATVKDSQWLDEEETSSQQARPKYEGKSCPTCQDTGFVPCDTCGASGVVRRPGEEYVFFCDACCGKKSFAVTTVEANATCASTRKGCRGELNETANKVQERGAETVSQIYTGAPPRLFR